jgi:antitoxin component of MazEF toxin-antitoxin module
MPTQKLKNRNIRKLTKVGKVSLSVTLPKDLVTGLKWKDKQKVVVKRKGSSLIIRDWKR